MGAPHPPLTLVHQTPAKERMHLAAAFHRRRRRRLLPVDTRHLHPVPPPFEGVGGKQDFRRVVRSIKLVPVDHCPADKEFCEASQKHVPVAGASLKRSKPRRRIVRKTSFPHLDERRVWTNLQKNIDAVVREGLYARVEAHRVARVMTPVTWLESFLQIEELSGSIGHERNPWSGKRYVTRRRLECIEHGLHQR